MLKQAESRQQHREEPTINADELRERLAQLERILLEARGGEGLPRTLGRSFEEYCEKYSIAPPLEMIMSGEGDDEIIIENPIGEEKGGLLGIWDALCQTATTTITKYLASIPTGISYEDVDSTVHSLIDATRDRIHAYEGEERVLRERENVDFRSDALAGLQERCFTSQIGKYTYEHCPFRNLTAKEEGQYSTLTLGKFHGWSSEGELEYTGGTYCWQGPLRSSTVSLVCGGENRVVAVSERSVCHYTVRFETPAVCDDPHQEVIMSDREEL